jgi:ATP-binding protein involved in chromosome partitioning
MSTTGHTTTVEQAVRAALATVEDPEIHRPITDLGMVKSVAVSPDGRAEVAVYLTVAGCPMRETITNRVTAAVSAVPGISSVGVTLDVMSDEQRTELRRSLRGDAAEPVIPFAQPGSLTRVYCVASGKGGVGKSSVTVNLAAAMAARGLAVGVVDADIYGHSVPRMLGTSARPTKVDDMIMPPQAHGVKVISIGMFTPGNEAVVWRGPMLHRALQQFLADVFWGDLDVLLLDLPPAPATSRSPPPSWCPTPSCWWSPPRRRPRPRSPSGPARSPCRPASGWPGWSRTCPGWSCPTAPDGGRSGPAAGRPWPTR